MAKQIMGMNKKGQTEGFFKIAAYILVILILIGLMVYAYKNWDQMSAAVSRFFDFARFGRG